MARSVIILSESIAGRYAGQPALADAIEAVGLPLSGVNRVVLTETRLHGSRIIGRAPIFDVIEEGFLDAGIVGGTHLSHVRGQGFHHPSIAERIAHWLASGADLSQLLIAAGYVDLLNPLEPKLPRMGARPMHLDELARYGPRLRQLGQQSAKLAHEAWHNAGQDYATSPTGFWVFETIVKASCLASLQAFFARCRTSYRHENGYVDDDVRLVHDTFFGRHPTVLGDVLR